jgi:hypothetical protein
MRSDEGNESFRRRAGRTWRRRKRSVIGKEWTPPGLQDVSAGPWCPSCHIRHPYNGKDKCSISYDMHDGVRTIQWLCPYTGQVIGQLPKEVKDDSTS